MSRIKPRHSRLFSVLSKCNHSKESKKETFQNPSKEFFHNLQDKFQTYRHSVGLNLISIINVNLLSSIIRAAKNGMSRPHPTRVLDPISDSSISCTKLSSRLLVTVATELSKWFLWSTWKLWDPWQIFSLKTQSEISLISDPYRLILDKMSGLFLRFEISTCLDQLMKKDA